MVVTHLNLFCHAKWYRPWMAGRQLVGVASWRTITTPDARRPSNHAQEDAAAVAALVSASTFTLFSPLTHGPDTKIILKAKENYNVITDIV